MFAFSNPVVAGTTLVRQAINSPNYVAGSAGWAIKADGSAEFNNVTLRAGQLVDGTSLEYSGPPALGNLIGSESAVAGVDTEGNAFVAGTAKYSGGVLAISMTGTGIQAFSAPGPAGPWSPSGGTMTMFATTFDVFASAAISLGGAPVSATGGTAANPTVITTDTWHNVTPPTGFTGLLRYRMNTDLTVTVQAALAVAATVAAGTVTLLTVPGPYVPQVVTKPEAPAFFINGTPATLAAMAALTQMRVYCNLAGTITVQAFVGGAANVGVTELDFSIEYPLT